MIQRTSQYECQERFPSSSKQQISSTFVKELNILRCSVFLVTSAKSFQSVDTVIPLFNLHFELCCLLNVWSYNFWPAKFALCCGNLDTAVTEAQNSHWWLLVINDVHYYCSIIFVTFVVCRSTILRRYLLFTTTLTSPLLRTRLSVCFKEYSRCNRAHLQAREGHARRWVN